MLNVRQLMVVVVAHAPPLGYHEVHVCTQVREEAVAKRGDRGGVQGCVVDTMATVREAGVDVLEEEHGPALLAALDATVVHAPLARLVEAARVLPDGCPEHAQRDREAGSQPSEQRVEACRRAEDADAAVEGGV